MRAIFLAALLALSATGAKAATYDLTGNGGVLGPAATFTTAGGPDITISAGWGAIGAPLSAKLFQSAEGLGVAHSADYIGGAPYIDGSPIGTAELVVVSFSRAVTLLNFTLNGVKDGDDHYDISFNGGAFEERIAALALNPVNRGGITSFILRASGLPEDGPLGDNQFILSGLEIAAVPLPAGIGLLGAALAGLGLAAARRRKVA